MTEKAEEQNGEELLRGVGEKLGDNLISSKINLGTVEVVVGADSLLAAMEILKNDSELQFNLFLSVTAVDYMDTEFIERGDDRFEVVYHLLSLSRNERIRVKVSLSEAKPEISTVSSLWSGADFMEREVWDMYGISFTEHPNLERILMYPEFEGHPLRKDYPIQGKQPRIPLRHPEVRNTAVDMVRAPLVQINPARKEAS